MSEHQLFEISQSAIIKNGNGAVLILKHRSGKWLLPGGRINVGENWLDALNREIKEETGITFQISGILDVDSFSDGAKFSYIVTFLGETEHENVVLGDEHNEYVWIAEPSELDRYDFWHEDIVKRIEKSFTQS